MNPEYKSLRPKLWLLLPVLVVIAVGAGLSVLVWLPASQADPTPEAVGRPMPASTPTSAAAPSPSRAAARDSVVQEAPRGPTLLSDSGSRAVAPSKAIPGEVGQISAQDAETPGGSAPQDPSSQVIFLPTAAGGAPATGAASGAPEMVIKVPAGEKVPAVFYETDPKPAPQQKMLDRIAAEFNETVANPPPGVPEQEIWEQARRRADEQFLKLYGHSAYNARHLQAAREAVREQRALEAARQQGDAAVGTPGAP